MFLLNIKFITRHKIFSINHHIYQRNIKINIFNRKHDNYELKIGNYRNLNPHRANIKWHLDVGVRECSALPCPLWPG